MPDYKLRLIVEGEDRASGPLLRAGGALGNIAQIAGGTLLARGIETAGRALSDIGGDALGAYADFERLSLSLESLVARELMNAGAADTMSEALGQSSGRAQELLGWIEELAVKSPFDQEGIAAAFRTTLAYGFASDEAQRLTLAMTDFAAGSGGTTFAMSRIGLALGQIRARGKLAAQEINQLTEAGLPVRQILAKAFNVTTAELEKMVSDGAIPAEAAIQAIVTTLEEDFGGAAERQAGTFSGLISSMQDLKEIGLREFFGGTFQAIQPYADRFVDTMSSPEMRANIRATGDALGESIAGGLAAIDQFLGDFVWEPTFKQVKIGDLFSFVAGEDGTKITVGDWFDFSTLGPQTKVTLGDFFDFVSGEGETSINIADWFTFDTSGGFTKIKLGDFVDLDFSVLASSITSKAKIGDFLDFSSVATADGLIKLSFNESDFDFDLSGPIAAFTTARDGVVAALTFPDGFSVPDLASVQTFFSEVAGLGQNDEGGLFGTIDTSALTTAADAVRSTVSGLSENLGGLQLAAQLAGGELSNQFTSIFSEGGTLSLATNFITSAIGGITEKLATVDAAAVGAGFSSVIGSIFDVFDRLDTAAISTMETAIPKVGELFEGILGFGTKLVEGIDGEDLGTQIAGFASGIVDKFGAALAAPDLPGIATAATGLIKGIASTFSDSVGSGQLTQVGASLGKLTTTIISQLSDTLSDPKFGDDIGASFGKILVGITQGISDILSGFNEGLEGGATDRLSNSFTSFVGNFVSGLSTELENADFGQVGLSLVKGIGNSLINILPGLNTDGLSGNLETVLGLGGGQGAPTGGFDLSGVPLIGDLFASEDPISVPVALDPEPGAFISLAEAETLGIQVVPEWHSQPIAPPEQPVVIPVEPQIEQSAMQRLFSGDRSVLDFGGTPEQGEIKMPELPEFNFPELPDFAWPTMPDFAWPSFPKFSWPSFPRFSWPSIPAPSWLNRLNVSSPSGGAPGVNATGTTSWRGGMTWVGEFGPELVSVPRNSQIYSAANSRQMVAAGAGGGTTINIYPTVNNGQDVESIAYRVRDILERRG